MKKLFVTGLAVLAAGLLASSFVACGNSNDDGDDSPVAYTPAESSSVEYTGSMTVNNTAYTSLTMTGNASNGTAVLAGSTGSVSGTYAQATTAAAAAKTPNLSGSYTLSFDFGTITMAVNNDVIQLSAGSVAASGSGTVKKDGDEALLTTLKGKTFVSGEYTITTEYPSGNSGDLKKEVKTIKKSYITGISDSQAKWHAWTESAGSGDNYSCWTYSYTISGNTITFTMPVNGQNDIKTATITSGTSFTMAAYSNDGMNMKWSAQPYTEGSVPSAGECTITKEYY